MSVALADPAGSAQLARADAYCQRLARRHYENFTVASAVLPADIRLHLARLYAYCRTTDDLGDETRSASGLRAWREEVVAALEQGGPPAHPVLLALRETVAECAVPLKPFLDLISANLQDQEVDAYSTWEQLLGYCLLSAAPVGRMVLAVLGIRGARAERLSDDVCIGLQLANFAQDVRVDAALGRRYLPEADVAALGVRGAIRAMCDRATTLLDSGEELESLTGGRLRAQLAMYRLGGLAIVDAVRRADYGTDVLRPQVTPMVKARLALDAVGMAAASRRPAVNARIGRSDIVAARRTCQRLARRNAANFYWGFVALPRSRRTAIYSLYDLARQVDDAVDSPGAGDPREQLEVVRARLRRALAGHPDDEVMAVVARTVVAHRIPHHELDELIEGVACDLTTRRYQTWDDLAEYCRLVASTVGRMCVRIFGFDDDVALLYADDLGRAMQLTNILRDVRGDLALGRIYLPADELAAHDIDADQLAGRVPSAGWNDMVAMQARRARGLFASGLRVERHIPGRAAVCTRTLAGLYQRILDEIERDPGLPLRGRLSLSPSRKAGVLLRAVLPAATPHTGTALAGVGGAGVGPRGGPA